ncbi:MAG: Diaminopimelate epimerase [Magnetococcales bacterium]|nr:Diaminopimelate epimerase [Magnetococcales bacterium]HIJ82716.1 diaminopimelate epimerase [Magnetococcales bacterium]
MSEFFSVDFFKCHGAGNDFMVVDETRSIQVPDAFKPAFARLTGVRGGGIGSDGIIFVSKHDEDHPRMQFFNPDGSEAEMSGNGLRCASRVAHEGYYAGRSPLIFVTRGGRFATFHFYSEEHRLPFIRIQVGRVETNPEKVLASRSTSPFIAQPFQVMGESLVGTILSIGNPHMIITVDRLHTIDFNRLGPALEHHPMFANRANISFVEVLDEKRILVQTHERGVGLTLSCGTGMTASVVAQVLNGYVANDSDIEVHTAGGLVWVHPQVTRDAITAQLTGNATHVYRATTQVSTQGAAMVFAAGEPMTKTHIFTEETVIYDHFARQSLFDTSILTGTSIENLVQARGAVS